LRIKICGVTSTSDAVSAAALGADAVGLNFFPQSKRCIDEATAAAILRELPVFLQPVAVFANMTLPQAVAFAGRLAGLRTIQLHGDVPEIGSASSFRFIQAFQVGGADDLVGITNYLERCRAGDALPAAVLVDSRVAGQLGGTGCPAPWDLLADFRPCVPLILAGGLTPENVAEAIRIVHPYAVDVASGVESAPGRKDQEKVRRFIANAREGATRYGV
jgi:phosphoribosylanthranilate isomerase